MPQDDTTNEAAKLNEAYSDLMMRALEQVNLADLLALQHKLSELQTLMPFTTALPVHQMTWSSDTSTPNPSEGS